MICNTANVLRELFTHSKDTLPTDKLEWIGNLLDASECEATNLSSDLETLAAAFGGLDNSSLPTNETISNIFWGLADRAGVISAMVHVAKEAEFIAKERTQMDKPPQTEREITP